MGAAASSAAAIVFVATLIPSGTGSAATVSDTDSATVTLDSPGSLTVDAFDPALGTLTSVEVSLSVEALVQVCVENTGAAAGSLAAGASRGVSPPSSPAVPVRRPPLPTLRRVPQLAPSNGAADCANGYDGAAGRFPGGVTAADTVFAQGSDQSTGAATLTDSAAMAPFIGTGTVAVTFTPASDTDLDVPSQWDSVVVGQGQLQASVTYTYTPGTGGGAGGGGGGGGGTPTTAAPPGTALPVTGTSSYPVAVIAAVAVVAGLGVLVAARRWRAVEGSGRNFGVIGLVVLTAAAVAPHQLARTPERAEPATAPASTTTQPAPTTSTAPPTTSLDRPRRWIRRRPRPRRRADVDHVDDVDDVDDDDDPDHVDEFDHVGGFDHVNVDRSTTVVVDHDDDAAARSR